MNDLSTTTMIFIKAILYLSIFSAFNSISNVFKATEINEFCINSNIGNPSMDAFSPVDSHMSTGIVRSNFSILTIYNGADFSKVIKPIVHSISIIMVKTAFWVISRLNKPNYSMRKISSTIKIDTSIHHAIVFIDSMASFLSRFTSSCFSVFFPIKFSIISIVDKFIENVFSSNHGVNNAIYNIDCQLMEVCH